MGSRARGFEKHMIYKRWWMPLKMLIPLVSLVLLSVLLLWWALS